MYHAQLLTKLQNISFCAIPTVATMDMGLEWEYMGPNGYGCELGSFASWPAYDVRPIVKDKLDVIQEHYENYALTPEDLADTDLASIISDNDLSCADVNDAIEGLENIFSDKYFYCLVHDNRLNLFATLDELKQAFADAYCTNWQHWEDCSDEELEEWIDRIAAEFDVFPTVRYISDEEWYGADE